MRQHPAPTPTLSLTLTLTLSLTLTLELYSRWSLYLLGAPTPWCGPSTLTLTLTLTRCANTLLWTIYGVMAAKDIFVYGPNAIGLALGIAQLLLKLIFPSK